MKKFKAKKAFILPDGRKIAAGTELELDDKAVKYLLLSGKVEQVKPSVKQPAAQAAETKTDQPAADVKAGSEPKGARK